MTNRDGGKGDTPRPINISQEEFDKRWDNIFSSAEKKESKIKVEVEADNDHVAILSTIPFGK